MSTPTTKRLSRYYLSARTAAPKGPKGEPTDPTIVAALIVAAALDDHVTRLEACLNPHDRDMDSWLK